MAPPLVAGLLGLYAVGKTVDNLRYYHDYHKNTGFYPRYPLRTFGSSVFDSLGSFGHLKKL